MKISLITEQEFTIAYKTLQRDVVNMKKKLESNRLHERTNLQKIFSDKEELALETCLKRAAEIYYGFTSYKSRKFAYEYANKNNKSIPASWGRKGNAAED